MFLSVDFEVCWRVCGHIYMEVRQLSKKKGIEILTLSYLQNVYFEL